MYVHTSTHTSIRMSLWVQVLRVSLHSKQRCNTSMSWKYCNMYAYYHIIVAATDSYRPTYSSSRENMRGEDDSSGTWSPGGHSLFRIALRAFLLMSVHTETTHSLTTRSTNTNTLEVIEYLHIRRGYPRVSPLHVHPMCARLLLDRERAAEIPDSTRAMHKMPARSQPRQESKR